MKSNLASLRGVGAPGERRFHIGTLSYTVPALLALMGWLLWADFCFYAVESVFPTVLPLKLRSLDAPNWVIALIMTTIPNLLNATVCPAVSYWSDRYRSPRGRRIPFILRTIPFLCLFLALIGLTPFLASFLVRIGVVRNEALSALMMFGVFAVGFQFFNMFVSSVYYYLFNDVVPREFLGLFLAIFRSVGALGAGVYYWLVFPKAETHFTYIFLGAAALYGVVFLAMCLKVKEGEYPAPPPLSGDSKLWTGIKTFLTESFSLRFYWLFYLFVALGATATTMNVFQIFFAQSVGLTLEQFGGFAGVAGLVSALLLLPCGLLVDKFHPLRTMLVAATLLPVLSLLPLVFLFFPVPAEWTFAVWCTVCGIALPFVTLYSASELPTFMQILPRDRFGQFCASSALLRSVAALFGGLLAGIMLDALKKVNPEPGLAYRYIPIWIAFFQGLSAICFWKLYREWKNLGGDTDYRPPEVGGKEASRAI